MIDDGLQIRETSLGLEIRLHVQPRAKRCEISGVFDGALKVKVTAPPVEDAANHAVIEYLARRLDVSKSKLCILSGSKSRDKVLQIKDISLEYLHKRLEL
jgi:uncharacterized protein (TIGR00251 family)